MADGESGGATHSDPLLGTKLGGYVIEGLLGKGAMGAVYRAMQVSLNRPVALKVMAPHLIGNQESAARFWREARAAAAINHPNLVQIFDFGDTEGSYFYAMELVDGLSLGAYLRRGDRFTERECVEVGREVTLALRAAHRAGVIHRDLKPDNLLLNSEGVVKVADLGVARFLPEGGEEPAGGRAAGWQDLQVWDALTVTGRGMGTPAFMSPEQVRGAKEVDQRSDFYALGATLFQLATCRLPYPGRTTAEVLAKQMMEPVPQARQVNPALGGAFSDLVGRLMAKDPADRPQTHEEILAALEGCLRAAKGEGGGPSRIQMVDAPRVGWLAELQRRRSVWAGAAAALAVAGFFLMRKPAGPDPWETLRQARRSEAEATPKPAPSAGIPSHPIVTSAVPAMAAASVETVTATGTVAGASMDAASAKAGVETPSKVTTATSGTNGPALAAPKPPTPRLSLTNLAAVTKERPFVNSLGMKFVPIPGTKALFSIWETRVRDFDAFVKDSGHSWSRAAGFDQTPDDPVVRASWDDAKAFCAWLSKKEGKEGKQYRLPTDQEWDAAVGKGKYPWGDQWPPPKGAENIVGEESMMLGGSQKLRAVIPGYRDDHQYTAPVGSYRVNKAGLYDMGGNAREWVEGWYTEALYRKQREGGGHRFSNETTFLASLKTGYLPRMSRGGNWCDCHTPDFLVSSVRFAHDPDTHAVSLGFRCVLVASSP